MTQDLERLFLALQKKVSPQFAELVCDALEILRAEVKNAGNRQKAEKEDKKTKPPGSNKKTGAKKGVTSGQKEEKGKKTRKKEKND